ncbi:MAG: hypothetical protein GY788_10500 [bacterium]|nr:hypothetical protein [bacterium]
MPKRTVMRRLLMITFGLVGGLLLATLLLGPEVAADTPVAVVAADDIVLHLPVSPSVDRIVSDLSTELRSQAATTNDPRIARGLQRLVGDRELLAQVATSPVDKFDTGEAAATATAMYDIELDKDTVTVIVLTVELVPGFGSTAGSREHEDGHALINLSMARRCAADALRVSVEAGFRGQSLINSMWNQLNAASDPVHTRFHEYVKNARYGQHLRHAKQAVADVDGCALI